MNEVSDYPRTNFGSPPFMIQSYLIQQEIVRSHEKVSHYKILINLPLIYVSSKFLVKNSNHLSIGKAREIFESKNIKIYFADLKLEIKNATNVRAMNI